ncbi:MAG: hypothetical protein PW734_06100 [Verrucomicrobium sp.]|nr:hypothetical protein [Verrucomicrobium sp.]
MDPLSDLTVSDHALLKGFQISTKELGTPYPDPLVALDLSAEDNVFLKDLRVLPPAYERGGGLCSHLIPAGPSPSHRAPERPPFTPADRDALGAWFESQPWFRAAHAPRQEQVKSEPLLQK